MKEDGSMNRMISILLSVLLLLGLQVFVGGCGKQSAEDKEAIRLIEVRIALILYPFTQGALPQKLKDVLVKAGIEVELGMVRSPESGVMLMSSDGVEITPVEGQWCKIISVVKGKGLDSLPDIEFKNGGFGLKKGEFYIKDGTLARLKGAVYRFSGNTWTKQRPE